MNLKRSYSVDWSQMTHDRGYCRAAVSTVTKIPFSRKAEGFLTNYANQKLVQRDAFRASSNNTGIVVF